MLSDRTTGSQRLKYFKWEMCTAGKPAPKQHLEQNTHGKPHLIVWHSALWFYRSLDTATGDVHLESAHSCAGSYRIKAQCIPATLGSSEIVHREKRKRGRGGSIHQTSFVLDIGIFSALCAADNSPRRCKNNPYVLRHCQVIFQFLNTSTEQHNILLSWLTFAQCLLPSLRSGSTLPLEIQNFLSWSFSACPLELSDCGAWSKTEGIHTASRK